MHSSGLLTEIFFKRFFSQHFIKTKILHIHFYKTGKQVISFKNMLEAKHIMEKEVRKVEP